MAAVACCLPRWLPELNAELALSLALPLAVALAVTGAEAENVLYGFNERAAQQEKRETATRQRSNAAAAQQQRIEVSLSVGGRFSCSALQKLRWQQQQQ